MGMEIGSTKRNRCRKCGLPVDSPLTLFWDCKNSPRFVINGLKLSMCFGMDWAGNGHGLRVHKVNR